MVVCFLKKIVGQCQWPVVGVMIGVGIGVWYFEIIFAKINEISTKWCFGVSTLKMTIFSKVLKKNNVI